MKIKLQNLKIKLKSINYIGFLTNDLTSYNNERKSIKNNRIYH